MTAARASPDRSQRMAGANITQFAPVLDSPPDTPENAVCNLGGVKARNAELHGIDSALHFEHVPCLALALAVWADSAPANARSISRGPVL